jgi:hypothetical protein
MPGVDFDGLLREAIGLDASSLGPSAIARAVAARQAAGRLDDVHGVWRRVRAAGFGEPEGEGHRQLRGSEVLTRQQPGFGRTDEQAAARRQQAQQYLHGARLRGRIEIDEHVAAEDEVVQRAPGEEIGREQVARPQLHVRPRLVGQLPLARSGRAEVAVAEGQVVAAEGIRAIGRALAQRDHARADVDAVDAEAVRRHTGVQQRDGHRVRFLAGGTRQAQQAQLAARRVGDQFRARHARERLESAGVAEEPGLRHHDGLDELLQFAR